MEITSTGDSEVQIPPLSPVTWSVTAVCSTGETYTWTHHGPIVVIERVADGALELIPNPPWRPDTRGGARWGLQVNPKADSGDG